MELLKRAWEHYKERVFPEITKKEEEAVKRVFYSGACIPILLLQSQANQKLPLDIIEKQMEDLFTHLILEKNTFVEEMISNEETTIH